MVKLRPIESSMISHVGYDEGEQLLRVKFKRGDATYEYSDVTVQAHDALIKAPSIGKHFHQFIRGTFESKKLSQDE